MDLRQKRRVDIGDVTLMWGNAAECKAELRDESVARFQGLPIGERMKAALELVRRHDRDEPDPA